MVITEPATLAVIADIHGKSWALDATLSDLVRRIVGGRSHTPHQARVFVKGIGGHLIEETGAICSW